MKPFLFLGTRAEDAAADSEYAAVLRCAGLDERDVRRVRLERDPLGPVDLADWSGIILGGGPFNVSDPAERKSAAQLRAEAELHDLATRVVDADFPFLGACYGIGVLGTLRGGVVDRHHAEPISAREITLTDAGRADRLLGTMPPTFDAFLGHKEAVRRLPAGAVLLASSADCPVHAFRLGDNVYATQFHPELDIDGLVLRIDTYRHHGYFDPPEQAEALMEMARASHVEHPTRLLARFVELFSC
ncbi:glutamine amidotransferase [Nocardioides sp. MAH-18]|uniref:Glutamine amidotransferase n=1 Tax=Nocardioides agri TaxID=2682843 RepID=A0A6L6XW77_9ACTN|nr:MULTISPECIES: glutamine amidotransferase [unclassified Nocardioides]MBA2954931.1 glutamine amidotransferase [Nocardioides sp. CGMCC 1.13656]MVQ49785.1 glutamine amidotransferase [Nocardioides sp. MAH-18]